MTSRPAPRRRIEIVGPLDRPAVEALSLELARLARRAGVEIRAIRIERRPPPRRSR